MKNDNNINHNQSGFASIVVALIMIIVLALMTVGFAKLARHEQQSALDKQLSTQAYYAAESGINDALYDIEHSNITAPITDGPARSTDAKPTECMNDIPEPARTSKNKVDDGRGVAYSCLMVDLKPKTLEWTNLAPNTDTTLSFSTVALSSLNIEWSSHDKNSLNALNPRDNNDKVFGRSATWKSPAVLQVMIVPLKGTISNANNESFTVYLYPGKSGSISNSTTYNPDETAQGPIVPGKCATSGTPKCNVTINGIPSAGVTGYMIHIIDYYDASDIFVTGNNKTSEFSNGQAKIDVTGKARNVLKRLQVRVPVNQLGPDSVPNYALEAQNICKRIVSFNEGTYFSQPDSMNPWFNATSPIDDPCKLDN